MQFLSDVYLRCPDCDGKRYRPEVLEVARSRRQAQHRRRARHDGRRGASRSSPAIPKCCARLQPLVDVGLEYLRLGQPVPTLSGGEAQRLKLAGHLAEAATSRRHARDAASCSCSTSRPPACISTTSRNYCARSAAARGRPFAARDRAQPRRDPRRGLDHRPGARRRRRRRRDRVRGHAGDAGRSARASHTGRALREYDAASASIGPGRRALAADAAQRFERRRAQQQRRTASRARRSSSTTRASTTCRTSTSTIPRDALHGRSPASRAPASRRSRSTSCSPKASAATSSR